MSQLPGVANAVLDDRKITQYLLNTVHPTGASKAKFFISFGFSPGNWAELKSALLHHPENNPVTSQVSSPFGQKFEVSCSLVAPDGRNPLHHLSMDHRASRPQSEVRHRVSEPLSEQADTAPPGPEDRAWHRSQSRRGFEVTGVDASARQIERAVQRAPSSIHPSRHDNHRGPSLRFRCSGRILFNNPYSA
jgi:hypothetical protein